MQNKNYIQSELDKNKEVLYTSAALSDIIFSEEYENKIINQLITDRGTFNAVVLMYRKSKRKTSIKLLIKKNIVTKLILCDILKLKIMYSSSENIEFDFKQINLINSNIYLNNNQDTIIKIKFLNESEKKDAIWIW